MNKLFVQYLISASVLILLLSGCASTPSSTPAGPEPSRSFKEYPDHGFNPQEYIHGMIKGGHNLLIWRNPATDLSKHKAVNLADFGERLLPAQDRFSYTPFAKYFNLSLQRSFKAIRNKSGYSLRVEGEIVECNPGSRAARYLVGFGAGKAAGAVVCEVYEPGTDRPCICIYARDTASYGMFGGNSIAMLNHIFNLIAVRLADVLEKEISH